MSTMIKVFNVKIRNGSTGEPVCGRYGFTSVQGAVPKLMMYLAETGRVDKAAEVSIVYSETVKLLDEFAGVSLLSHEELERLKGEDDS